MSKEERIDTALGMTKNKEGNWELVTFSYNSVTKEVTNVHIDCVDNDKRLCIEKFKIAAGNNILFREVQ